MLLLVSECPGHTGREKWKGKEVGMRYEDEDRRLVLGMWNENRKKFQMRI